MAEQKKEQEIMVVDFEEMLQFVEKRLASKGMKVGREEIITVIQAEEDFLKEKGVIEELEA